MARVRIHAHALRGCETWASGAGCVQAKGSINGNSDSNGSSDNSNSDGGGGCGGGNGNGNGNGGDCCLRSDSDRSP